MAVVAAAATAMATVTATVTAIEPLHRGNGGVEDVGLLRTRPRRTKAVAKFASTANEAVAEVASTADNPSTADKDVARLASMVDEAPRPHPRRTRTSSLATGEWRSGICWLSEAAS